jgi:hypothetical protein
MNLKIQYTDTKHDKITVNEAECRVKVSRLTPIKKIHLIQLAYQTIRGYKKCLATLRGNVFLDEESNTLIVILSTKSKKDLKNKTQKFTYKIS